MMYRSIKVGETLFAYWLRQVIHGWRILWNGK